MGPPNARLGSHRRYIAGGVPSVFGTPSSRPHTGHSGMGDACIGLPNANFSVWGPVAHTGIPRSGLRSPVRRTFLLRMQDGTLETRNRYSLRDDTSFPCTGDACVAPTTRLPKWVDVSFASWELSTSVAGQSWAPKREMLRLGPLTTWPHRSFGPNTGLFWRVPCIQKTESSISYRLIGVKA